MIICVRLLLVPYKLYVMQQIVRPFSDRMGFSPCAPLADHGTSKCMDGHRGRCIVDRVAENGRKLSMLTPVGTDWFKGTWNETSLVEKEPEPVKEVE